MSDATRQRYALSTGKGLQGSPPKTPEPGYKKGGTIRATGSFSGKPAGGGKKK